MDEGVSHLAQFQYCNCMAQLFKSPRSALVSQLKFFVLWTDVFFSSVWSCRHVVILPASGLTTLFLFCERL